MTCRGRLRLEGVGLEQRHRVDRDGRDDRDDRVDDEALRRVGVVRGAALLGAARFTVVRREARPAVELDAGPALRRVAAIVAAVGAAAGAVRGAVVRARDLRVRARLAVELAAVLRFGGRRGREREDRMRSESGFRGRRRPRGFGKLS